MLNTSLNSSSNSLRVWERLSDVSIVLNGVCFAVLLFGGVVCSVTFLGGDSWECVCFIAQTCLG